MRAIAAAVFALAVAVPGAAQDLPARWDELTASDWPKAIEKSAATCVLPIGILEKHGPHAPPQLERRHDYVVYFFDPAPDPAVQE